MLIGNKWKVESDTGNITVFRKSTGGKSRKTGKISTEEAWHTEGYFSTVKGALTFLVNQEVKETGLKEFKIVSDKIDELHNLIGRLPNITASDFQQPPGEKRVLSPEHLAKLQEGRKARKHKVVGDTTQQ